MIEKKDNKNTIKLFLIGDTLTGKTSIIKSLLNFPFFEKTLATIGFDNYITQIELKNKKTIKLQIFDTAGQEKYRSLALQLLKTKCEGIILIYSIENENSFENLFEYWINELNNIIDISNYPIYLVGNKNDLKDERLIKFEEGQKKANEFNIKFMETSAKTGYNIKQLFTNITQDIYDSFYLLENNEIKKRTESTNIEISIDDKPKKKCFVLKAYGYVKKKMKKIF